MAARFWNGMSIRDTAVAIHQDLSWNFDKWNTFLASRGITTSSSDMESNYILAILALVKDSCVPPTDLWTIKSSLFRRFTRFGAINPLKIINSTAEPNGLASTILEVVVAPKFLFQPRCLLPQPQRMTAVKSTKDYLPINHSIWRNLDSSFKKLIFKRRCRKLELMLKYKSAGRNSLQSLSHQICSSLILKIAKNMILVGGLWTHQLKKWKIILLFPMTPEAVQMRIAIMIEVYSIPDRLLLSLSKTVLTNANGINEIVVMLIDFWGFRA